MSLSEGDNWNKGRESKWREILRSREENNLKEANKSIGI